jgi:sec-independent protein translocase protein TatA
MPELFVILALMLLVFGPKKLPEIARGIGQGIQEFKHAMRDAFEGGSAPARLSPPPAGRADPPAAVPDKETGTAGGESR